MLLIIARVYNFYSTYVKHILKQRKYNKTLSIMIYYIILTTIICNYVCAYYLTSTQKIYIKNILQNSNDPIIKQKVKTLLISKYSLWAMKQARSFRIKYAIKSNYVRNSELLQSALLGLSKSMKNYNGQVEVPYYSYYYVLSELYKCLTRNQPFGRFTHRQMMVHKMKPMENTRVEPFGTNKQYYEDVGPSHELTYSHYTETLLDELYAMSPHEKRIFLLKYDIHTMKKIRTAKEISLLL